MKLSRLKSLIIKEFYSIWRDKKLRMMIFIPPVVQLLVFSFAVTLDVTNVSMGILDKDNTPISRELTAKFENSPFFGKTFYIKKQSDIKDIVDEQRAIAVLVINEDFSRNLYSGSYPSVQLILDARKTNASQIVAGYAMSIISDFNLEKNLVKHNIQLETRSWYNPNLIYCWFTVTMLIGILCMIVTLILTALSLAKEKELGTFEQLIVSPLVPYEILTGKLVVPVFFGLFDATIMLFISMMVFKIPFLGSVFLLYFAMLVFLSSIAGVGLFISSLCKTQQQAILGSFVFVLPAIMLSGYITPIENIRPEWLQDLTILNPLRFFLVIVKGIYLKGMPVTLVLSNLVPLMLIAFMSLTSADWLFRRKLD